MKPKQELLQCTLTFNYITGNVEFCVKTRKSVNVKNRHPYQITINKNDYKKLKREVFETCSKKELEKVQWFIDSELKAIEHHKQELEKFIRIYEKVQNMTIKDLDKVVEELESGVNNYDK